MVFTITVPMQNYIQMHIFVCNGGVRAEIWTFRAVDQKHLERSEMWCWRRMEKISWTDHVRNEEVLLTVKEQRNILHEISTRKANWIGHILCRNCLLHWIVYSHSGMEPHNIKVPYTAGY
jgi:hypothetical protein